MNQLTPLPTPEKEFVPQLHLPVTLVAAGLICVGALVALIGGTPAAIGLSLPLALAILGLAAVSLLLDWWHKGMGRWFVILSLALVVLLLRSRLDAPGGLVLLVLPAVLGMVMLGDAAGIGMAVIMALLAIFAGSATAITSLEMAMAVAAIGIVCALYWVAFRSAQELVAWSWRHYCEALAALEEARDSRTQIRQTLDDLAHANRQLELLNKRLAAAKAVAEEARKSKAAFVANVSHEFRTPLNMIIGLSDLLLETPHIYGAQLSPLLLEDLEIVRRNSQHLLSMVNDVLDLSQIEADRLTLHRDRVNLAEVVAKSVAVVQPLLTKKQVQMHVQVAPGLPAVDCDRTRVRQVIVNLLSNAARHTEGGSVTVEAAHDEQWITVCVRDTGPGIPPEEVTHLFEPFYRGTFGAKRSESGSGLGLSISRQLIQMHQGDMWVESSVGVGSAFCFRLPIEAAPQLAGGVDRWLMEDWPWYERTRPTQLPNPPTLPRVLICDANPDLQTALARFHDQVVYARTPSLIDAVTALEEAPAELLILNAAAPRLLLEQMSQAQRLWSDLPIVGCCLPPKLGNVLAAGAAGQLLKPITQADLNAVLAQLSPSPQTTLLVDDDEDGRRLFQRMLTVAHPQMRVVTACNGAEALEMLRTEAPDLLLLDIILPDIDGWEVLAAKMQDETLRSIPTFLLSAQDSNREPLATPLILLGRGELLPFHTLLRSVQLMPRLLRLM